MGLYVGANYHPHDWKPERWRTDAKLMKEAGFEVVRLGHLCWDSYEMEDGVYTFEWFDEVMDVFHEEEIKVFLDISVRPAPIWVHKLCPGCDIYSKDGMRQPSIRRYMEDVDDSKYQFYALRFARTIVRRYKDHPALMGFGLCNEQGDGPISYSEAAKKRFQEWLRNKYTTVDVLNQKWNTKRWSRQVSFFEDIELPENEIAKGAPEAFLDMRRFFGDGILTFMKKLKELVEEEAPGVKHSSNHVAESDYLGFDYLKGCDEFVDFPGIGFYPDINPEDESTLMYVLMYVTHRLGELEKPMWSLEFQSGSFGDYEAKNGVIRMYALLCLAYRNQMTLAWTWRSMLGGEEQFYFGLLDHDGTCSNKYHEFARIAADYKVLEEYSFPYLPRPEAAIAYCYENIPIFDYNKSFYRMPYKQQVVNAFKVFYQRNLDCNLVDLRNMKKDYKVLIIPAHAIMTCEMEQNVREFIYHGGIVIMTAYSAKVDETNTVFDTPQPGLLCEVFGIRIRGFRRTHIRPVREPDKTPLKRFVIENEEGESIGYNAAYWETIELNSARPFASYKEGDEGCAVSVNSYGKGKAYYISAESNSSVIGWLYDTIAFRENLQVGITVGEGVVVRKLSEKEYLFVNTTSKEKEIDITKEAKGVLNGGLITGKLVLSPYDGEVLLGEDLLPRMK